MAEVTYGTPAAKRRVLGDVVCKIFVVNGASGSAIHTGMTGILWVSNQPFCQAGTASLVTGIAVSGSTITLTASNTMVNEVILVLSRAG
jgi:hypothetical protein